ncbi:MAG TPA: ABC transporter permease [Angustibacter sp.]|nr:ABC transporter permease [Angustibacter sp.]
MSAAPTVADVATPPSRRRTLSAGWVGLGLLAVMVVLAVLAPLVAPHDPEAVDPARIMQPPSVSHLFGTDSLGRDVLSRTVFALRASLAVAVGSVALSATLAIPLGALAGYFGRWVDTAISRPLDLLLVLPPLLLAVALITILGPGALVAGIAIALIYLPILARVMRGSALETAALPYVEGARARGAGHLRVLVGHLVPNAVGPVLVQVSILGGFALQIEAALSFLGLGTQPPTPSLGLMLADGRNTLTQAPWAEVFPGLVLALAVLAFILVGDSLRARLDPHGLSE